MISMETGLKAFNLTSETKRSVQYHPVSDIFSSVTKNSQYL